MDTKDLIRYRNENKLCWSCGKQSDSPRYKDSFYCKEHWKIVQRLGFAAMNIFPTQDE